MYMGLNSLHLPSVAQRLAVNRLAVGFNLARLGTEEAVKDPAVSSRIPVSEGADSLEGASDCLL